MTLEEIMREVWVNLGEPTDIDPETDTSYQGGPILRWVANEAQRQIAVWKDFVSGRRVRFRELFASEFFRMITRSGTLAAAPLGPTALDLDDGSPIVGDINQRYKGWVIEVRGQRRLIVDHSEDNVITVFPAFSPEPEIGDEFKLYKRFSWMLRPGAQYAEDHLTLPGVNRERAEGNLVEILKITDLQDKRALIKAPRGENFAKDMDSVSFPRLWYRFGNKLVFDAAPPEERWYDMEYYRLPGDMVGLEDMPEIPEMFHYALVLWGTEWGMRRARENSEKYATGQDLQRFMRTMLTQYEMEYDRDHDSGRLSKF